MKRILIFSLNYYPFVGGAEVAIKEITDRVSATEIEFHLITCRFDSNLPTHEKLGNVWVHRIGWARPGLTLSETFAPNVYWAKIFYVPLAGLKAMTLHREKKFDGAWAMMSYMVFPLVLMRLLFVRIPYVLTLQEGDPFERVFERMRIKLFSPLLFYGIRHASVVQAISTYLGEWARRCGFKGQLEIVPNGVDTTLFSQVHTAVEIAAKRASFETPQRSTLLVTTSRLVHKNGIDSVIRALPLLKDVLFIVYGIGPDEKMLKALAKELNVEQRVRFMGQLSHQELPLTLSACDIFIRPSRSEGMGNSFIEAMAAGLPVIATQEGGIADFLFDAKRNPERTATGWAVDVDSSEQIAEAVKNILSHPEAVAHIKENAREMVIQNYDWNLIAANMQKLFERAAETQ